MVILIFTILIELATLVLASRYYIAKKRVFRHGNKTIGIITKIIHYQSWAGTKMCKLLIEYEVNNKQFTNIVSMPSNDCSSKLDENVDIIFENGAPNNAHASIDYNSGLKAYHKIIYTLTGIAISMIALRSILMYTCPANDAPLISLITFSVLCIAILTLLGLFGSSYVSLSRKRYIVSGEVKEKVESKNKTTYKIIYCVNGFSFIFLKTMDKQNGINKGDIVTVSYLHNKPFIADMID